METAGIILDLYDNPGDLKAIFSSMSVVPESVKTAHSLTSDERDALPDDAFALVLLNGGDRLRKYACVDQGNTELSVAYFFKHGHKLPLEAQKVAAENLSIACEWYGIEVPEELQKVALLGALATAITAPSIIKGTSQKIKSNLAAANSGGGAIVTPRQQTYIGAMSKGAEISGTSLAPDQAPGDLVSAVERKPSQSNTSATKSAEVGHLVTGHGGETGEALAQGQELSEEQYKKAPQMSLKAIKPHVDVTNSSPPEKLVEKKAAHYAYEGVYPLDSIEQVKTASAYFDEFNVKMAPFMRRDFAQAMVKRSSALGVPVSEYARGVGSGVYATEAQVRAGIDNRLMYVNEKQASILERVYSSRTSVPPDLYAATLAEFDKAADIDYRYGPHLMDPVDSTYGLDKQAQDESDSWVNGCDYITKRQLEQYAVTAALTISDDYGPDFLKEFRKDAWGVFNSLPLDQKRRMARAAGDNSPTGLHDVA